MAFNINNFGSVTTRWGNQANYYPTYWIYNAEADSLVTVNTAGYFNTALSTYDVNSGDKISISTSQVTSPLSFSGTFRNDGAGNLFVDWDRTYYISTAVANISADASTTFFPQVPPGVIVQVSGVISAAVTVASAHITFYIGGDAITGGAFTVAVAGSGPGVLYTATPTAANILDANETCSVQSDGESTTACALIAGFKIISPAQV